MAEMMSLLIVIVSALPGYGMVRLMPENGNSSWELQVVSGQAVYAGGATRSISFYVTVPLADSYIITTCVQPNTVVIRNISTDAEQLFVPAVAQVGASTISVTTKSRPWRLYIEIDLMGAAVCVPVVAPNSWWAGIASNSVLHISGEYWQAAVAQTVALGAAVLVMMIRWAVGQYEQRRTGVHPDAL